MMMGFCKRSVHSFLGLIDPLNIDTNIEKSPCKCAAGVSSSPSTTLPSAVLGLINATGDSHRTPNVLESSSVKSSSPSSISSGYSRGIGFIDDIGGGVDGLMSCTESLGFESSDERTVDDEIEFCSRIKPASMTNWRKNGGRREVKKFPPPISSLNHNGQPSFFLRQVRKGGRLELTEVRIHRPEILSADRQDGRLILHLIKKENSDTIDEQHYKDDKEQESESEDEQESQQMEEDKGKFEDEEQEEERAGEWQFPTKAEGLRRCHELATRHHDHRHHHHNLHVWSQHCVTTS